MPTSALFNFRQVDQNNFLSLDVSSLNFRITTGESFKLYVYARDKNNGARFGLIYGEQRVDANGDSIVDADGNIVVFSNRSYAPAANYITDNSGNLPWQQTFYDRGFRTYVAVPEPASWAMLIVGFGRVGAVARKPMA